MGDKLFSEWPEQRGERVVLRRLRPSDAESLRELTEDPKVYRYLPTFLFEKKYPEPRVAIERLYTEGLDNSLILGIFENGGFRGLAELYGLREEIRKVSVGYRLTARSWGRGLATETLGLLVRRLQEETDIEIITASTMVENQASASVLRKNGFTLVVRAADEDWGYGAPTPTDKWIR